MKKYLQTKLPMLEMIVVGSILFVVNLFTANKWNDWLGGVAVFCGFLYTAAVEDLAGNSERTNKKINTKQLRRSYFLKEALWFSFFIINKNYAPLAGILIFLIFPYWRKYSSQIFNNN